MKNFLDYASSRYYAGSPIITDAEFDRLAEMHNYEYVGTPVQDGVPHTYSMYSLRKCYVGEKIIELPGETVETPKLDGAAISLLYVEGRFVLGLTRGDGKRGQDITEKIKHLVPNSIYKVTCQITGEVVAPKSIPNARNYAAGALNLQDIEEFKKRQLKFVAYDIMYPNNINVLYTQDMSFLHDMGFYDVYGLGHILTNTYPTDGVVIRLNNKKKFEELGYTANHPRGAYALKTRGEGVVTKLLDVEWQVGRSGVVSPVAILNPVMIGDAQVSRATLHNQAYIENLDLEIGCTVEIIRAGEIIPRVVRRIND